MKCEIKESILDVRGTDLSGYFCLGTFDSLYCPSYCIKMICNVDDIEINLYLYKIDIIHHKYIVMANFSSIPDIAVINNEEIIEIVENYFKREYTYNLDNVSVSISESNYFNYDTFDLLFKSSKKSSGE